MPAYLTPFFQEERAVAFSAMEIFLNSARMKSANAKRLMKKHKQQGMHDFHEHHYKYRET